MARFIIRTSIPVVILTSVVGLPLGGFLMLMGIANLINPDVPEEYYTQNTLMTLLVSLLGLACFLVVISVIWGAFSDEEDKAIPGSDLGLFNLRSPSIRHLTPPPQREP